MAPVFPRKTATKLEFFQQKVARYQSQQLAVAASLASKVAAADQAIVLLSKPSLTQAEVQQLLTLHDQVS